MFLRASSLEVCSYFIHLQSNFSTSGTMHLSPKFKTYAENQVQVVFDPEKISLSDILRWFWEAHDPTQGMGQGNDRGTQCFSSRSFSLRCFFEIAETCRLMLAKVRWNLDLDDLVRLIILYRSHCIIV